jgi:hypothetical protein
MGEVRENPLHLGTTIRHRLDRRGDLQLNRALHTIVLRTVL